MPYLKFASREERMKARDIQLDLSQQNGEKVKGLIAVINDSTQGIVDFYSREPYLEAFDKAGILYKILPREQISGPFVDYLRANHPEFSDEL